MQSLNFQNKQGGILNAYLLTLLAVVIIMLVATGYFFYGLQPIDSSSEELVVFEVERGDGFRDISARLSREDLIRSISVFKLFTFISGKAQVLKPGSYELSSSMSVPQIVDKLALGQPLDKQVTFPEGVTVKDMDLLLDNAGIEGVNLSEYDVDLLKDDYPFLKEALSLEGFLFPDTYRFNIETSTDDVVRKLLDNFHKKVWTKISDRVDWYDIIVLASYLEREIPDFEDRQVVAGILLKRLNDGMLLQVDATLSYAKCDGQYIGCEQLQIGRDDIEMASPYNTYKRLGWTPTPISNPGPESIEASLNPVETSFWYYLSSRETGETIFSVDLKEHNDNRIIHL